MPAGVRTEVRVLGTVEVTGPAGRAQLAGPRQRAVVGMLALRVGTPVPGWRLVEGMWGDDPPRTAMRSLHSHVARVRQALDGCGMRDVLVTTDAGYALTLAPESVDAWRFEEQVRLARAALVDGPDRVRAAADLFRGALALWRHESALADAQPIGWAAAEVDRLAETRLTASEDLWDAELRLGRRGDTVDELERLLVTHPLRERLVGLLMLGLYRSGRQAAALADELGVDPGLELLELHTRMLRRDAGLASGVPEATPTRPAPATAPAQLPARVGHFTGRAAELAALDRLVDQPAEDLGIAVISGPAGMGKTALAVQWAHRIADRFPDGQLFVDLGGADPRTAVSPSAALAQLLRSLGVPTDRIPVEQSERSALYRSLLGGGRFLVVLDNCGTTEDALPLIPASPASLLVVTSRNAMAALATYHAVCPISVAEFGAAESLTLLSKVLGAQTVERDSASAAELVRLCGRMPLALRIAAAMVASQQHRTIRDLTSDLAGVDRLDMLRVEGDSRSVRAVFVSTYAALATPTARLFRLLGLHPGQTFTAHSAAAIADLSPDLAQQGIDELLTAHLIARAGNRRYRFLDLVALFARQCATVDESPSQREAALRRLIDWYLVVVDAANRAVHPGRDRVTPAPRYRPSELPFAVDHQAALIFLDEERANLLPVVRHAAGAGPDGAAWQLTYLLAGFYESRGHLDERVEMCSLGVTAAQQSGDPVAEGLMHSGLGVAYIAVRRYDDALASLHRALPLMRAGGDRRGLGHVYNNIAVVHSGRESFAAAVDAFRQALAVHSEHGYRLGIGLALNNIGHTYVRMRTPERGFADLAAALAIFREIANPRLEASALHSLGEASLGIGDFDAALDHFSGAVAIWRRIGDQRDEARALNSLGQVHLRRGAAAKALDHFNQALLLARAIGDEHLAAVTLGAVTSCYTAQAAHRP
jgi:DNA-binding SARP family transcriptional activator/tetratricopeptide (TPR) repeat protein